MCWVLDMLTRALTSSGFTHFFACDHRTSSQSYARCRCTHCHWGCVRRLRARPNGPEPACTSPHRASRLCASRWPPPRAMPPRALPPRAMQHGWGWGSPRRLGSGSSSTRRLPWRPCPMCLAASAPCMSMLAPRVCSLVTPGQVRTKARPLN